MRRPFHHDGGFNWIATSPGLESGDTPEQPNRSSVILYEDGSPLAESHAPHAHIRTQGGGRYSHWGREIHFSSSDNSDPNANGRDYLARKEPNRVFEAGQFRRRIEPSEGQVDSIFCRCPVCLGLDHEVLFPSFHGEFVNGEYDGCAVCRFQTIVICRGCGAVFRNPVIPTLNQTHYQLPGNWDPVLFQDRFQRLADQIAPRVALAPGALYLDVGAGPGWLAETLRIFYPQMRTVLLEPSLAVATAIKRSGRDDVVIPSYIHDATLPQNAFSLISCCGVDYLFQNHRRDMAHICELLNEEGVFYIERNVFIEQKAYCQFPIRDLEDMFGPNNMMNLWLGRDQFVDYVNQFVDVFDVIDYVSDVAPDIIARPNQMRGVFGRKRRSERVGGSAPRNWYGDHILALRAKVKESSLADLRALAGDGIRKVAVSGSEPEVTALLALIQECGLFEVSRVEVAPVGQGGRDMGWLDDTLEVDGYLIASVEDQNRYLAQLRRAGLGGKALPCFRRGVSLFAGTTGDSGPLQIKAFLPHLIATLKTEEGER
ncbi:hypothetical protein MTBSS4_250045 [Magnetospirillum sp. SS-4]|nr:hypothetical protein MTBSS4_250045 [Magnetospirillum sp. SS-4]